MSEIEVPLIFVVMSGCATVLLASVLAYVLTNRSSSSKNHSTSKKKGGASPKPEAMDKSRYPGGKLTVYYATQTGTAESFARQLEREGTEHGFLMHVVDLEDVEVDQIVPDLQDEENSAARVIFVTATYGEGEAPDNAAAFVQALCDKASTEILFERSSVDNAEIPEPECLKGVEYCVFGLANRQYDHFNAMGKFFDHALERLGAKRILPLGVGDDDDDLENDFETWKDTQLWPTLKKLYIGGAVVTQERPSRTVSMPESQYAIEYHDAKAAVKAVENAANEPIHASSRHYFSAVDCPVTKVRELRTKDDPGSTVHVEVDISKACLNYQTADNLGVLPMNEASIVESVANSLGFDLDQVFSLKAAPKHEWHGIPFPMPISIRECLTRYCDLTAAPRRSDLKLLAAYAKDVTDQKALLRMASKEGRAEYREKIVDEYIGLANLFKLCPSIEMPLEHFLNVCPMMQTRFFTISSSSSVHPKTIHLTVAVAKAHRKDGSVFNGVCSNFLANRRPGEDMIRVYNRPSTFRLPKDSNLPIIMIGPGTGVAPMRALLQERAYQRNKKQQAVGENILYFGCKNESQDYIYREELEAFQKDGVLNKLRLAFSRQNSEKVYVQHLLVEDGQETWKLISEKGAHLYVCGGVKMGQDVCKALNSIISSHGKFSADESKDYLAKLSAEGRFVQELWA